MTDSLRRWGRIAEGAPGNIASALYGPFRQARPGSYFTDGQDGRPTGTDAQAHTFLNIGDGSMTEQPLLGESGGLFGALLDPGMQQPGHQQALPGPAPTVQNWNMDNGK